MATDGANPKGKFECFQCNEDLKAIVRGACRRKGPRPVSLNVRLDGKSLGEVIVSCSLGHQNAFPCDDPEVTAADSGAA